MEIVFSPPALIKEIRPYAENTKSIIPQKEV